MKKFLGTLIALLFATHTWANGASSHYNASTAKRSSASQAKTQTKTNKDYSAVLLQGSLRANIIRIAHQYGWNTVVWNAPEDYSWIGTTRISGKDLQTILAKILIKYPLQAQLYQGNRVLAIVPRNLP